MCAAATEVQGYCINRLPHSTATKEVRYCLIAGDFYYNPSLKEVYVFEEGGMGSYQSVWLPRQDQLQEMVIGSDWCKDCFFDVEAKDKRFTPQAEPFILSQMFVDHCKWQYQQCGMDTLEQYWLSFAMKGIYNKKWNPETKQWITK